MSDSKIYMMPDSGTTRSLDPNLLLGMMSNGGGFGNNSWIWIIFLFFLYGWRGNGLFGNGSDGVSGSVERDLLMQAINGNGTAIGQLSTRLNCDINSVQTAINSVQSSIQSVGNQVGLTGQQVINAIQSGNMSLGQQLAQCCCDNKLAICQQTNTLNTAINSVSTGMERGFSSVAYESQAQTCALQNSIRDNTATVVAKLDAIEDARKDRQISDLTAALTAANSRAERAAELAPIYKSLSDIQCKQPNTVTVPYQPFVTIPNCVAYNAAMFGNLPYQNGSIWS